MSDHDGVATERGPYLTPSRALQLERAIARLEGRFLERFERIDRELAELRAHEAEAIRGRVQAELEQLRALTGQKKEAPTT